MHGNTVGNLRLCRADEPNLCVIRNCLLLDYKREKCRKRVAGLLEKREKNWSGALVKY